MCFYPIYWLWLHNQWSQRCCFDRLVGALLATVDASVIWTGPFPTELDGCRIQNQANQASLEYRNITVFIEKRTIQNNQAFFQCINSWGNNINVNLDFPLIPETTPSIEIYSFTADWEPNNKNSSNQANIVFTTSYTLGVFLSCCLCIIVCLWAFMF